MFLVQLTYLVPLDEVDKFLPAHRAYLHDYYQKGLFLLSGPIKPRTGGILIALTKDRAYLESILQNDPYALASIASYDITEFTPVMHCEELKEIISRSEGNLC